jgi:hypothetical protein
MENGGSDELQGAMPILAFLFSSLLSIAQALEVKAVSVDVSNLKLPEQSGILVYTEAIVSQTQVQLENVQLVIGGTPFYPGIHVAFVFDVIAGTAICQMVGYTKGKLVGAKEDQEINTFEMDVHGVTHLYKATYMGPHRRRGTSEVHCDI